MTKSLLFALLFAIPAQAQCLDRTGWNATAIMVDAPEGRYVAESEDTCIGEAIASAEPFAFPMWSKDRMEPDGPGPESGDPLQLVREVESKRHLMTPVETLAYEAGGIYIVHVVDDSLDAVVDSTIGVLQEARATIDAQQDSLASLRAQIQTLQGEIAPLLARIDEIEASIDFNVERLRQALAAFREE